MITLTNADNALKSFYLDAVVSALDVKINPFMAEIEKTTQNVMGRDVRRIYTVGYSNGLGSGTEDGNLPHASRREYAQLVAPLKNFYGTIEITDKAIRASASNEGAFVNLLNGEMEGLLETAKFNFGRMLFGDGTGILSTISEFSDGWLVVDNVKNFTVGMNIDIWVGDTVIEEASVVKVDYAGNKIFAFKNQAANPFPGAVGGVCYLHGSKGGELTGLEAIFSDEELYGMQREVPGMTACVEKNVGEIDEVIIESTMDRLEAETGKRPNFIICSWEVKRALQSHYMKNGISLPAMKTQGGYTAIDFNGVPIVADRFCPKDTMYLLNTDCFKLYQLCDWQWLEAEDGKILKQVAGKPVYTATLVKYAELVCDLPAAQAKLTGITID